MNVVAAVARPCVKKKIFISFIRNSFVFPWRFAVLGDVTDFAAIVTLGGGDVKHIESVFVVWRGDCDSRKFCWFLFAFVMAVVTMMFVGLLVYDPRGCPFSCKLIDKIH